MEDRVGGEEAVVEVGEEVRRQEEAERAFREEAERGVVAVEKGGVEPVAVLAAAKWSHLVLGLAALGAAEEKRVPRVGGVRERRPDGGRHFFLAGHWFVPPLRDTSPNAVHAAATLGRAGGTLPIAGGAFPRHAIGLKRTALSSERDSPALVQ